MNDHGQLRWLRGIFYDEPEKINTILECMNGITAAALLTRDQEIVEMLEGEKKKYTVCEFSQCGCKTPIKVLDAFITTLTQGKEKDL